MEQTKIYTALKGVRGRAPVDLKALESLLVRFSYLTVELPRIKEIDINPLLASPEGLMALDARIVLFDAAVRDQELPRPAIRPYPAQYISQWKMKDGTDVLIRPIRPEDEPLLVRFHESLSAQTVYLRYFHMEKLDTRVSHERLLRKCFVDYDREIALVVQMPVDATGAQEIVAVGRLTRGSDRGEGEVAVLVTDKFQHHGLGRELLRRLVEIGRAEKFDRIVAHILPQNAGMLALANHYAFVVVPDPDPTQVTAVLTLHSA
jgi:acetyltransferase